MPSRRVHRLNEQLKREIAEILNRDVRDPRIGQPTVTGVEVAPDLSTARVHVQLDGSVSDAAGAMSGLQIAAPFIRKSLGRVLRIRRIPELHFKEDRTLEQAMRIERILREVLPEAEQDPGGGETPSDGETPGEDGASW